MFGALKTGLLGGTVWAVLASAIGDAAAEIVAITAALAGLGWVTQKILVPAAKAFQRTHQAVGALEDLGVFMEETRIAVQVAERAAVAAEARADKIDRLADRLDLVERHIGLWASEDAVRARAAIQAAEATARRHLDK